MRHSNSLGSIGAAIAAACAIGIAACGALSVPGDEIGGQSQAVTTGPCLYKTATCTTECNYTCYPFTLPSPSPLPQPPYKITQTLTATIKTSCAGGSCAAACSTGSPKCPAGVTIFLDACVLKSSSSWTSGCVTTYADPAPSPSPSPAQ